MKLVVLGRVAAAYVARVARQSDLPVMVVAEVSADEANRWAEQLAGEHSPVDPLASLPGPEDAVVVGSDVRRAAELTRALATAGRDVVLADVPVGDERSWTGLASPINQRVMLSRPLRFDRLLATTKATIRAGAVGTPRVVQISWTFADAADGGHVDRRVIELATELADAALWLLDDRASAVYAVSCTVDGPPLARVNLQTRQGSLALLEASVATPGLPAFRDLGLQASDGAIYHRATRDDLLWTTDGVGILSYPDDALAREAAAWAGQAPGDGQDLARSDAVIDNVAAMRAIADSLARGEPVSVVEGLV